MNVSGENKLNLRNTYFAIGCGIFAALFFMAWFFYLERICMADTAYRTVLMLITGKPAIFIFRFGAFIPQLLPLTAIWLHAGLKTVMVVNSLSFVLYFFCLYLVAFKLSKEHLLFFLIPLYLILMVNEEFYWPQSEFQQGMVWLCLYAVILFEHKFAKYPSWLFFLVHTLIIAWIQTFHLLIFVPIAFLLVYFYWIDKPVLTMRFVIHMAICILCMAVRWEAGKYNPYESSKQDLVHSLRQYLPHLFSLGSVAEFWHKLPLEYAGYVIVFLIAVVWLVRAGKYFLAFF